MMGSDKLNYKEMKRELLLSILLFVSIYSYSTIINVPAEQATIQDGINAAANGDTVLVADGTYLENIDFIGKAITVASNFIIDADMLHISNTIINGSQPINPNLGSCVRFTSNEDTTSVIIGFTLTEGTGCLAQPMNMNIGGGIYCNNSSPKIISNVITNNNLALISGIAISNNSSPFLLNNVISYNSATNNCGGIGVIYGNATNLTTIKNCQIFGNTSAGNGGGLFIYDSDIEVVNCSISNNQAGLYGGGIYIQNADVNISNVNISYTSIIGNSATYDGGGIESANAACVPIITNSTIYDNEAPSNGSQIDCWLGGLEVANSIVGGSTSNGSICFGSSLTTFSFCDFYNSSGPDFDGDLVPPTLGVITTVNANGDPSDEFMNILLDPLFVDLANNDFHLSEYSPCMDAGDPDSPLDPDGTIADMGAFYFNQGTTAAESIQYSVDNYQLSNFPNPFNQTTTIEFSIELNQQNELTQLVIYNLKGQLVKTLVNEKLDAGTHHIIWNGNNENNKAVSSGIYYCKIKIGGKYASTKKMILMK